VKISGISFKAYQQEFTKQNYAPAKNIVLHPFAI